MSAFRDTPSEISDFFDWAALADRVEAFGLAAIAHAMREAPGTDRAEIAREAARRLDAVDEATNLRDGLDSAAHSILMGF